VPGTDGGHQCRSASEGEPPLILDRTEAYTAILIDDLISKGTNEPYRMFTSRAEFRLHLRIDNADQRLTPHGRRVGLIADEAWADFQAKQERIAALASLLESARVSGELPAALEAKVGNVAGQTLSQVLRRPEVVIEDLVPLLRKLNPALFAWAESDATAPGHLPVEVRNELKSVETEIKYAGYLRQQEKAIERLKRSEERTIPEWFTYSGVSGLSREMKEKLERIRPATVGQASRIPGVTPAAVALVNIYIEIQARKRKLAQAAVEDGL
jgi:tRNA uridine 5-carboxymethylaminomethyl modification enzyme